MKRAILTGFEPFGPYRFNPVQDTAREFNGKKLNGVEIVGLVLPCTYYGAFDLLSQKMDELMPDVILSTGLASRVPMIRFEALGRNIMDGKYPDADGRFPKNEPLIPGEKQSYFTNTDTPSIVKNLIMQGVPAQSSVYPEWFVCNSLIYLTARRIDKENLPIKQAFFHTPWTKDYLAKIHIEPEKKTIEKKMLLKTIELTIDYLIHKV